MLALAKDTLLLVLSNCSWFDLLGVEQVCKQLLDTCSSVYSILYNQRYSRYSVQPKQDYKRHLLTAGSVVCYNVRENTKDFLPIPDVKKYLRLEFAIVYINAHDECIYNGTLLQINAVDVELYDMLNVLTTEALYIYEVHGPFHLAYSLPIANGKSIAEMACCETHDGRFLEICEKNSGLCWEDATEEYMESFPALGKTFPRTRTVGYYPIYAVMDEYVHMLTNRTGNVTTLPIKAKVGEFYLDLYLFITEEGELIAVTWQLDDKGNRCNFSHSIVDSCLLPNPITLDDDDCVYYIKRAW